jgi:hypothetical protein
MGFSQVMCTWTLKLLSSEVGMQQQEYSIGPQSLIIEEVCWYAAKAAIAAQLMEQKVIISKT